ncbi:FUSC family protein [Legionella spiritensis]|uniref:FUSC family protein n=1 Tax=Legionella spiritensis TaxID=452 RepID=UPI000F6FB4ED|nr:FUSC family protein [Legionella spiritensis]VEG91814.1 Fusaric acid resistance protein family [Legionella spiritensis]
MQHARTLKKKLEYARFIHLLIIYLTALVIFLFSTVPHRQWILLTVLVVSAGIEPGLILKRSIHRILGTLSALIVLLPLLYIMQLNYRLIPIVFAIALIGMVVSSLNPARYDISVFFITVTVFLLLAQTMQDNTPEGPFEMVINRGICTLIGIIIVMTSDYFLFGTYQYSQKLYLYHQIMIYDLLKNTGREIQQARDNEVNSVLFIERLRNNFIHKFSLIETSSENLMLDLKASEPIKQRVQSFHKLIWEIRRLIFALNFSELLVPSPEASRTHWLRYTTLMAKARQEFINIEKRK